MELQGAAPVIAFFSIQRWKQRRGVPAVIDDSAVLQQVKIASRNDCLGESATNLDVNRFVREGSRAGKDRFIAKEESDVGESTYIASFSLNFVGTWRSDSKRNKIVSWPFFFSFLENLYYAVRILPYGLLI